MTVGVNHVNLPLTEQLTFPDASPVLLRCPCRINLSKRPFVEGLRDGVVWSEPTELVKAVEGGEEVGLVCRGSSLPKTRGSVEKETSLVVRILVASGGSGGVELVGESSISRGSRSECPWASLVNAVSDRWGASGLYFEDIRALNALKTTPTAFFFSSLLTTWMKSSIFGHVRSAAEVPAITHPPGAVMVLESWEYQREVVHIWHEIAGFYPSLIPSSTQIQGFTLERTASILEGLSKQDRRWHTL